MLSAVVAVLTAEEQILGLRQPSGVGARPRPMATELCNQNDAGTTDATLLNRVMTFPSPSYDNVKVMHSDSEFSNSHLGPNLRAPYNSKQQPLRHSMNNIDNNLASPFIGGCGDTIDSGNNQAGLDTIYCALQPQIWSNNLVDNMAQVSPIFSVLQGSVPPIRMGSFT